ncbi:hypothetical protein C8Q80DRAFT_1119408 [Daedaleopsis nitida]|nr:hypothetical protein C8Q80DRAFT_1119408 [Daedaleopsis nitida]
MKNWTSVVMALDSHYRAPDRLDRMLCYMHRQRHNRHIVQEDTGLFLEDNVIETNKHTDVRTPVIGQNEHIPPTVTSTNDDTSILQHIPHFGTCFLLNIDWATEDTQVSHMEWQSVASNTQMLMLHVQGAGDISFNSTICVVLGNELFQTEREVANGFPSSCYNCTCWGFDCVVNLIVVDGVTPGIVSKCMYCFKNGIHMSALLYTTNSDPVLYSTMLHILAMKKVCTFLWYLGTVADSNCTPRMYKVHQVNVAITPNCQCLYRHIYTSTLRYDQLTKKRYSMGRNNYRSVIYCSSVVANI